MYVFCVWAPLAFSILFLLLRNNFQSLCCAQGFFTVLECRTNVIKSLTFLKLFVCCLCALYFCSF